MASVELGRYITGDQVFEVTLSALLGLETEIRDVYIRRGIKTDTTSEGLHDKNHTVEGVVTELEVPGVIDIIRAHLKQLNTSAKERRIGKPPFDI